MPSFTGALASNYIISTHSITLPEALTLDRNYYWRVRGYNSHSFCNPATGTSRFRTAEITAVNSIAAATNLRVSPNPTTVGQSFVLEFEAARPFSATLRLVAATGQLLQAQTLAVQAGNNRFPIAHYELTPGLYFVWIESEEGRAVERVVVR